MTKHSKQYISETMQKRPFKYGLPDGKPERMPHILPIRPIFQNDISTQKRADTVSLPYLLSIIIYDAILQIQSMPHLPLIQRCPHT